jgi:metal-responsive CopG/Arc/MetJ family transcriptional regulator
MKQAKTIVSFSVEQEVKEGIDRMAAEQGRSKSDILRDMYRSYRFKKALEDIQAEGRVIAARLGIESDEDVFRYLGEN